jgi:tetratricopeptide (TPR) repeat protein
MRSIIILGTGLLVLASMPALADTFQDCAQRSDAELSVRACTELIDSAKLTKKQQAQALLLRGETFLKTGFYVWAQDDFSTAATADGGVEASAEALQCGTLLQMRRNREALNHCDRALELEPGNAYALNNKGRVFLAQQQFPAALKLFQAAAKRSPNWATPYVNLGMTFLGMSDQRRAFASFDRAAKLDPNDAATFLFEARAHYQLGHAGKALTVVRHAIDLDGGSPDALELQGRILEALGRKSEALASYVAAHEKDPTRIALKDHIRQMMTPGQPPAAGAVAKPGQPT